MKDNTQAADAVDRTCLVYILQALNFLSILALCAAAIVRFTYFGDEQAPKDPFFFMLTFYLFPMAALLLAAEMQYQRVLKYFQFLGYLYGKGLFMVFVALLLFDAKFPVDTAVSVAVSLVGFFNIVATCVVPGGQMPNVLLQRAAKDKASDSESEESENDADENDHLLPMTYSRNQPTSKSRSSGKPVRSDNNN